MVCSRHVVLVKDVSVSTFFVSVHHTRLCSHVHVHFVCVCVPLFRKKTSRQQDTAVDILALPFKNSEWVPAVIGCQHRVEKRFIHPHHNYLVARSIFSRTPW